MASASPKKEDVFGSKVIPSNAVDGPYVIGRTQLPKLGLTQSHVKELSTPRCNDWGNPFL